MGMASPQKSLLSIRQLLSLCFPLEKALNLHRIITEPNSVAVSTTHLPSSLDVLNRVLSGEFTASSLRQAVFISSQLVNQCNACNSTFNRVQSEVREHEPLLALDGGKGPGLDCLQQICGQAADFLAPEGFLVLETGGE